MPLHARDRSRNLVSTKGHARPISNSSTLENRAFRFLRPHDASSSLWKRQDMRFLFIAHDRQHRAWLVLRPPPFRISLSHTPGSLHRGSIAIIFKTGRCMGS